LYREVFTTIILVSILGGIFLESW